MPCIVVYDIQRGPVAADAIDAVLDRNFTHELAEALYVSNVDRLPPAGLMAEWAVRCAYTDGVSGWAPVVLVGDDAYNLVHAALQHPSDKRTVARFLHGVMQYVTLGRRVRNGLWPDVDVQLSPCRNQSRQMRLALMPITTEDDDDNLTLARNQGRELLAQAKMVLGG